MLMLIVDLKKPKLNWDNEYAVVKQNMNMIYEFALMFLIIITCIVVGFIFRNVNYIIPTTVLTLIFLTSSIILNTYVKRNQGKLFDKIY